MRSATTSVVLHTNVEHKTGEYPVKLRVTFQRKSKYYHLNNYYFSEKDYDRIMGDKPRDEFKKVKLEISKKEKEASDIIEKLPYFTFDLFEKQFLRGQKKADTNIYNWLNNTSTQLTSEGRIKTSRLYSSSLQSLKNYTKKSELSFYDISVEFLYEYEKWFVEDQQNSVTTLGIYLRNVRAVFNEAIAQGVIIKDAYPFGMRKYEIPSSKNEKKSLIIEDIHKIYTYPSIENSSEDRWKAMWFFSYLCNGVNVKDICLLKNHNKSDGKIIFHRHKTRRTKRKDLKPIIVIITEEIMGILDKWGNQSDKDDDYVFPILSKGMSQLKIQATIDQTTKNINKYIRRVAKEVGITKDVTTYTARHSFATVLKRAGVSTEFISESIGHSDLRTTEKYLDSFEDDSKIKNAKKLLDF